MSRHDTGATRITDIDRNLLVASVDLVGLDLSSIQERSQRKQKASTRKHEETIP
jgi:hypothetical protein